MPRELTHGTWVTLNDKEAMNPHSKRRNRTDLPCCCSSDCSCGGMRGAVSSATTDGLRRLAMMLIADVLAQREALRLTFFNVSAREV
jgi:hypothetical protein